MPAWWSEKDERQYRHILESCKISRRGVKTCKRIAAATVNKRRTTEGRTQKQRRARRRKLLG